MHVTNLPLYKHPNPQTLSLNSKQKPIFIRQTPFTNIQSNPMAKIRNYAVLLLAVAVLVSIVAAEPAAGGIDRRSRSRVGGIDRRSRSKAYIEAACRSTRYPGLCVHCLSLFTNNNGTTLHNPQELARMALTVSLYKALQTRFYLQKVAKELRAGKAKEYPVVIDCLEQINDSVDQLSQSIKELRGLDGASVTDDFSYHISNVVTWTSAALTDANSCVDQFPGRRMSKLKATLKVKVLNVVQVTSNALALFNRYASRYRVNAP